RMKWCQASGKAQETSAPRMAWPRASGRILRSAAKSQAITVPPMKVSGTRTGFGQWSAAKREPARREAHTGFCVAARKRLVRYEFRATCWSRQKEGIRRSAPAIDEAAGGEARRAASPPQA